MPQDDTLTLDSVISATGGQLSADLEGETVILHLGSGVYFGLSDVGARIWELIERPTSVSAVRDVLLEEYDVDAAQCERDVLALLDELWSHTLIEVHPQSESSACSALASR